MQFFHLFSFVVVASYAAALPQPAGLSEKYSNSVDTTLASGLEARSYQPGLNSQKNSATLTLLKRQDDSEESPEDGSEDDSEDGSEDGSEEESPLEEAESDLWLLSSIVDQATVGGSKVPENVKAAGAAVGGDAEKALVKYLDRVLHVSEELEKWVEVSGDNLDTVIKSGLSDEEYANVEPSLKEAKDKLTADVSDNLQQVNAALSVIAETPGSAKQEMETVHAALGRVFDAYKVYFEVLNSQMGRVEASEAIQEHFSEASASFVEFASRRQGLYDEVAQKLEAAPSE
ncbi:hypothetical protein BASA50_007653 [Batrachochytrium salamandrivorans]|uniref:Uncharacterized protein n=1 Tax=Batrachochytrium salamandrivorans TaxID=1357716 RepID=A0ABQ8F6D2_9FUNG|nr:hypothetical protein BASA50_007652 [Batrachochytrium salamandrivorans]KAH6593021.1 hypothetical protein BASA50_007653 [Batrachochytrium salamandrivorans]KAH9269696.1 hypothetical protein BASA83_008168 [Batrachochytrium salamandrivorans]KAH9269698.1 hypothetical protein BASA83_008170 [Batrachochytrium salamandrivorans]